MLSQNNIMNYKSVEPLWNNERQNNNIELQSHLWLQILANLPPSLDMISSTTESWFMK